MPTGLALTLIFWVPVNGSGTMKMIYAFVTYNLFISILYTIVGVAKNSLMPLMTQDGASRGALARYSLIFGLGGTILGMSVTFPFLYALGGDLRAWRIIFCVYGIITTVGLLLSFDLTKEHVQSVEAVTKSDVEEKMSFMESVRNFVQNKYFIFALAMTVAVNISVQIIGHILRGIAAMTANIPILAAGTIIAALATGPLSVPVNMLAADAVDYGEYLTNKRIEGVGSAIVSFSQKVSSGLASGMVGWILALTGYVANEVQNGTTVFGITFMFAWLGKVPATPPIGRPGGLITEITWNPGRLEVICLHGSLRFPISDEW